MRENLPEVAAMRVFVGVVALVIAIGSPAYGGGIDDREPRPFVATQREDIGSAPVREYTDVHQKAPFRDVVIEEYHSAGAEWGMGVASTVLSVFYTPVRLVVGVVGAGLGGVEGWLTGGDLRTARSMWRPTVEGAYFVRPDHLDRTERYQFGNFDPLARERSTLRGREVIIRHEEPIASVESETVPAGAVEVAPSASPPDSDGSDDR